MCLIHKWKYDGDKKIKIILFIIIIISVMSVMCLSGCVQQKEIFVGKIINIVPHIGYGQPYYMVYFENHNELLFKGESITYVELNRSVKLIIDDSGVWIPKGWTLIDFEYQEGK